VDSRAVLDAVVKRKIPSPRRESKPRTSIVQPVAQHCSDWDIAVLYDSLLPQRPEVNAIRRQVEARGYRRRYVFCVASCVSDKDNVFIPCSRWSTLDRFAGQTGEGIQKFPDWRPGARTAIVSLFYESV